MMTTLKPVTRIVHAVSATGTRLACAVEMLDHDLTHRRGTRLETFDQRRDRIVAEVRQELRLPVVERALGERAVEQAILRAVWDRTQHVHHRRAERLDGRDRLLAVRQRATVCGDDADELRSGSVRGA